MDIGHQSPSTISTAQNIGSFCVVRPLSLFPLSPHCIDFLMHSKSTLSLSLLFPVPHFAYTRLASKFWLLISCQIVSVQRYSHLKAKKKSVSLCLSLSPIRPSIMNDPYYRMMQNYLPKPTLSLFKLTPALELQISSLHLCVFSFLLVRQSISCHFCCFQVPIERIFVLLFL